MLMMRGVRGATTVTENTDKAITEGTQELLMALVEANGIEIEHVASIMFTTTQDLNAVYPAKAARDLGWTQTALMGFQEMDVPGGTSFCIRVLIHWNTTKQLDEIVHVYLNAAINLRPDILQKG